MQISQVNHNNPYNSASTSYSFPRDPQTTVYNALDKLPADLLAKLKSSRGFQEAEKTAKTDNTSQAWANVLHWIDGFTRNFQAAESSATKQVSTVQETASLLAEQLKKTTPSQPETKQLARGASKATNRRQIEHDLNGKDFTKSSDVEINALLRNHFV